MDSIELELRVPHFVPCFVPNFAPKKAKDSGTLPGRPALEAH